MRRLTGLSMGLALCVTVLWANPAEANGWNNLKAGVQGIIQFPADPVIHIFTPPEDFIDELPAGRYTAHILGLFSGTLLAVYRVGMGATDIVLAPFWVFPTMSPEARWNWFDAEYEDL
jgi:hypothetical protein